MSVFSQPCLPATVGGHEACQAFGAEHLGTRRVPSFAPTRGRCAPKVDRQCSVCLGCGLNHTCLACGAHNECGARGAPYRICVCLSLRVCVCVIACAWVRRPWLPRCSFQPFSNAQAEPGRLVPLPILFVKYRVPPRSAMKAQDPSSRPTRSSIRSGPGVNLPSFSSR